MISESHPKAVYDIRNNLFGYESKSLHQTSFHLRKRFANMSIISEIRPVIATQEFFWCQKLIIDWLIGWTAISTTSLTINNCWSVITIGVNNLDRLPIEVGNLHHANPIWLTTFRIWTLDMQYVCMSEMQNVLDIWSQCFGYDFSDIVSLFVI